MFRVRDEFREPATPQKHGGNVLQMTHEKPERWSATSQDTPASLKGKLQDVESWMDDFLNRLCVVTGAFLHLICMTDGINEAEWTIYQNWRDWMNYQFSQSLELDGSFISEPLQRDA